ncbi:hypothetical protein TD95_000675 [Thielaviopsis punctulata]|uniref:Zn(2)-C6 fungal-type domain-containing protein n=1 Tax=Thielaviopsis punctulata TaxID=72032 RepID=A0A0F4ZHQ3_9PEZI|nr:hypothetical protein TD95_000675 [Thielaviopsis punctulata]
MDIASNGSPRHELSPAVPAKRPRQPSPDPSSAALTAHQPSPHSPTSTVADTAMSGAESTVTAQSTPRLASAAHPASSGSAKGGQSSNFRNVSACNRCRLRKNRCDQKLPSCASCAKAGVACVGYDPITKKEIPRSYVYYLETRVEILETLLRQNGIDAPPASDLDICSKLGFGPTNLRSAVTPARSAAGQPNPDAGAPTATVPQGQTNSQTGGMPNIISASKPKSLASTSGVSFARVVYAAVQHSVSDAPGAANTGSVAGNIGVGASGASVGVRNSGPNSTSMRDSFFGLHTKPSIRPAPFPSKQVASRLVNLYFEHANPQIPILHRVEFMNTFEKAYAPTPVRGPRELYLLNMVFAIGGGVIVGEPVRSQTRAPAQTVQNAGADKDANEQAQPEEYHASAIVHLESCLSNSTGSLDVLQAVLLLANFALLRPVPPGLWYIVGVAVRLAVDLGLHYEDGTDLDQPQSSDLKRSLDETARERGKRMYIRDMRRRLWWCTYSLDRLVSTCVGRPFGVSDLLITTEFPSSMDDRYITPTGFIEPPDIPEPSYKNVSLHYLRLRLLQSEILQVLQFNQARVARENGQNLNNPHIHSHLMSPFLARFESFRSWRIDIDRRLFQWRELAPRREETGVAFSTEFLELNYWQAIILLYRQSLSVPAMFESEYNTSREVNSPASFQAELVEDEDRIYVKVAEAGQRILRIYRQLHLNSLVSYTYLSTHHLFMAGISYLYAIWHSPVVRSRLTMDEVDFTVLAAKSVFTDMIDKCPPAETCRDAFDRTAKATIKMVNSQGGFGMPLNKRPRRYRHARDWHSVSDMPLFSSTPVPAVPASGSASLQRAQGSTASSAGFSMDMSVADALSSPSLSAGGDGCASPQFSQPRTGFEAAEPMGAATGVMSGIVSVGMSPRETGTPLDSSLMNNGQVTPQTGPAAGNSANGFMSAAQSFSAGMEYSPLDMDFLRSLPPGAPDMGPLDQVPLNLGFGLNWDGIMCHDYSDGSAQQVNIFDNFFFGGQQQNGGM